MNPDNAPLYCLLALWMNLAWFSVLTYLDMRKLSARVASLDKRIVFLDDCASKAQFEYTNARVTHLTNHLKMTGILKSFATQKHLRKRNK